MCGRVGLLESIAQAPELGPTADHRRLLPMERLIDHRNETVGTDRLDLALHCERFDRLSLDGGTD